jgi:hypothetical protein
MGANGFTVRRLVFATARSATVPGERAARAQLPATGPEARFVTLCVREPDTLAAGDLASAANDLTSWNATVEIAMRHRVSAYVLEAAIREALTLPEAAWHLLRAATLRTVILTTQLDGDLHVLTVSLQAAGIPVLVLKGPTLVRTIYPRPALRPYADLDLAVRRDDEAAAVRVLLAHGYTEIAYDAEVRREHAGHLHEGAAFHRQFLSADEQILVELHIDPLQLGLRPTCEAGRWQRARAVPGLPGGLMLCPEDQIVHLSAHVHKHGFDRLIWLKDLDLLLRTYQNRIDWTLVEQTARDEGVLGSVWYSLYLAELLLEAPVPPGLLGVLCPSLPLRLLYGWVWPVPRIAGLNGFMRRRSVQFHAAESWRGMLPSLILMGRRTDRLRATARAAFRRQ